MGRVYNITEMHMFKKRRVLISLAIVLFIVLVCSVAFVCTNFASQQLSYNLHGDTIPSMKSVVGRRTIIGFSTNYQIDIEKHEYNYINIKNATDDILQYMNHLKINNDFNTTRDYDLTNSEGEIQLVKKSNDNDKIILITINYTLDKYSIKIVKGIGSINTTKLDNIY